MAHIRGQERFVYQAVYEHVHDTMLTQLDWAGTTLGTVQTPRYPYGASRPLTWLEQPPDPKLTSIEPNSVAFSEGRMPDEQEEELGASGGGLVSTTHTFFIDVYGESQSIARAIAADLRMILIGRHDNGTRYLTLPNYWVTGNPALAGHLLHFEDVEVDFPALGSTSKMHWVVIKATAVHEYNA